MACHIIIDKYIVSFNSNNNSTKINIIPSINYIIKRIDISDFPIKTLGNDYKNMYLLNLIKDGKINFNDILEYKI
jgi:hypothetical protein